jgi:GMP synthase-like glutamine amidotransferase
MNIFIINGSSQYSSLFTSMGHTVTEDPQEAELAVFTGGSDVTPFMYGDQKHPRTGNSVQRDELERYYFNAFHAHNVPMVGICRGAQLLNVMSGGRMYQHVDKHCGDHAITDLETGETVEVSSTHHQMMMPSTDGLLVASSALGGSREWYDGQVARKDISQEDIEVVYYKNTNCLCFQPHPEFDGYPKMREYFKGLLSKYLDVK